MRTVLFVLTCFVAPAQPAFDAATIKPFVPGNGNRTFFFGGSSGGPGTSDPGRIRYPLVTLKALIITAYDVKDVQISGPSWLGTERFEMQATMPPETTKEQFQVMLQNMLAERFKLTVHRETRELPMYSMVIGRNGPKMKESADVPVSDEPRRPGPLKMGPDGFPVLPASNRSDMLMMMTPFGARLIGQKQTMQQLAERLSSILSKPVTNETALNAKYDFTLTYSMDGLNGEMRPVIAAAGGTPRETPPDVEPPQNIFVALQSQLGLKLEPKKGSVALLVIDHAEKTPTEN